MSEPAQHHAVNVVGPGEGQGGGQLVAAQPAFLVQRLVFEPDAQAARRHSFCPQPAARQG